MLTDVKSDAIFALEITIYLSWKLFAASSIKIYTIMVYKYDNLVACYLLI